MTELSAEKLAGLRKTAEAASPGPWSQWNPATGPSHITIGGKVAFESLESATRFADDEVIPHWCDATHIAAFDPETVLALLDRIEELEAAEARLDKIRARHLRAGTKAQSVCVHCDTAWPCETIKILDGEADDH